MSADLLSAVVAAARRSSDEREAVTPLRHLERQIERQPAGDEFRRSLGAAGVRIIAECKRRSPSKGVLRAAYDPVAIATGYERAGAAAISVLTEPTFFDGSLGHLRAVRRAVRIPLLRKDFIVTPYQIVEAAASGADAVLLIVAALDDDMLRSLAAEAGRLGLATLVEVHDETELERAVAADADVIGVNSRNLKTLSVDQTVLDRLGPEIPKQAIAVAESGLKTAQDLVRLRNAGYRAFLMGERFMVEADPGAALDAVRRTASETLV